MSFCRALIHRFLNLCCHRQALPLDEPIREPINFVAMGLVDEHLGEDGRRWIEWHDDMSDGLGRMPIHKPRRGAIRELY